MNLYIGAIINMDLFWAFLFVSPYVILFIFIIKDLVQSIKEKHTRS